MSTSQLPHQRTTGGAQCACSASEGASTTLCYRNLSMSDLSDDRILIYLDGEGVQPDTVDARALLALASAFVGLFDKVALTVTGELPLRGLAIVPKCAAVAITHVGDDSDNVGRAMKKTLRVVSGDDDPPYGAGQYLASLHKVIQHLPQGQRAGVQHGEWSSQLVVPIRKTHRAKSVVPMRLTVFGAQDRDNPKLLFESSIQTRKIQLDTTREQADGLWRYWGKSIQATAAVHYNDKLEITEGTLLDWSPLDTETSPLEALRDIFLNAGSEDADRKH